MTHTISWDDVAKIMEVAGKDPRIRMAIMNDADGEIAFGPDRPKPLTEEEKKKKEKEAMESTVRLLKDYGYLPKEVQLKQ